jgi:hypothetical protein
MAGRPSNKPASVAAAEAAAPWRWRWPCTGRGVTLDRQARRCTNSKTLWWLVAIPLAGCGGTEVSQLAGPDGVRCLTELSGLPSSVTASAAQVTGVVLTERECSWDATSSASWLTISPGKGQGETTVTLTIASNGTSSSRTATLVVNEARATVTQAAAATPQPPSQPPSTVVSFSGSVSNLIGVCPIVGFTVAGRQVITDTNTRFNGGNCNSLRNGMAVEIEGEQLTNSVVRATRVRRDDDD